MTMNMYVVAVALMVGTTAGLGLCRAQGRTQGWRGWMTRELAALERGRPLDI